MVSGKMHVISQIWWHQLSGLCFCDDKFFYVEKNYSSWKIYAVQFHANIKLKKSIFSRTFLSFCKFNNLHLFFIHHSSQSIQVISRAARFNQYTQLRVDFKLVETKNNTVRKWFWMKFAHSLSISHRPVFFSPSREVHSFIIHSLYGSECNSTNVSFSILTTICRLRCY